MAIILNDNIKTNAPKPTDSRYLNVSTPRNSVSEFLTNTPISVRYIGLTANIAGVEYWFEGGINDINFVQKGVGGSIDVLDYRELAKEIRNKIYIDAGNGSDITGDGTQSNPYQTIEYAIKQTKPLISSVKYVLAPGYNYIINNPLNELLQSKESSSIIIFTVESGVYENVLSNKTVSSNQFFSHGILGGGLTPGQHIGQYCVDHTTGEYLPIFYNNNNTLFTAGSKTYDVLNITTTTIRRLTTGIEFTLTDNCNFPIGCENLNVLINKIESFSNPYGFLFNYCYLTINGGIYIPNAWISSFKSTIRINGVTNFCPYNIFKGGLEHSSVLINYPICTALIGGCLIGNPYQQINNPAIIGTDERIPHMGFFDCGLYNFDYFCGYDSTRGNYGASICVAGVFKNVQNSNFLSMFTVNKGRHIFDDLGFPIWDYDLGDEGAASYNGGDVQFVYDSLNDINLSGLKDYIGNNIIEGFITGTGSPIGVITPRLIGERYVDLSTNTIYTAIGLSNTSWI